MGLKKHKDVDRVVCLREKNQANPNERLIKTFFLQPFSRPSPPPGSKSNAIKLIRRSHRISLWALNVAQTLPL